MNYSSIVLPSPGDPDNLFQMPVSSASDLRRRQSFFAAIGKGHPFIGLRWYFRNQVFFEPLFTTDSLGAYLVRIAPQSMEVVFHNLYHVTARIANRWFDFHWAARNDSNIVCTVTNLELDKLRSAVAKVRNINSHYGRRNGKDLSLSMCLSLSKGQIERVDQSFDRCKFPVRFDAQGREGGETCLTLLTKLIEYGAPELGIGRTSCSSRLFNLLRINPNLRLVNVYSNASYSHVKWPVSRLLKLALGPPDMKHILQIWAREFPIPIPGEAYDHNFEFNPKVSPG